MSFLERHDPEYVELLEDHGRFVASHEPVPKPLVSEHLYL